MSWPLPNFPASSQTRVPQGLCMASFASFGLCLNVTFPEGPSKFISSKVILPLKIYHTDLFISIVCNLLIPSFIPTPSAFM